MTIRIHLLAALAVASFGASTALAQDDVIRPAKLMVVEANDGGVTRQFFGQVVARQTVDLAFQVSGQIVEFPVEEGEDIAEGALIASLDLEPFELQLQQAQLQFDQAQRQVERFDQLTSSVSEVAREDASTQLGLARVALRNAEVALGHARLVSPFDGLVAMRNVANFTTTAQGTPVVRLHDMSELRIEIDVPEVLFQRAGESTPVDLVAKFPTSEKTYPLEVREFNAEASSVGQTFRATLALPRPEGLVVLPGSSATVFATINLGPVQQLVPASAIRIGNDGSTTVMRFLPEDGDIGSVEEVAVEVEATRDGQFNLISGVEPGDEIVRVGAHAMTDGQKISRFNGFRN